MGNEKEYKLRRIIGIPFSAIVSYLIYHFFLVEVLDKKWAIIITLIIFLAGYGLWIEESNKSQFYKNHREK